MATRCTNTMVFVQTVRFTTLASQTGGTGDSRYMFRIKIREVKNDNIIITITIIMIYDRAVLRTNKKKKKSYDTTAITASRGMNSI